MKIFQGTSGNDRLVVSQLAGAQAFDWLQGLAGDDSFLLDGPMLFVWPGAGNDRVETTSFGGLWVVYLDSPIGIDYSEADGRILDGAANIGIRPNFDPPKELLEPHFFDFSGDLYGQTIEIAFHAFLRDEAKLENLEALTRQIGLDCDQARAVLAKL